jgi:hypothetical protein
MVCRPRNRSEDARGKFEIRDAFIALARRP